MLLIAITAVLLILRWSAGSNTNIERAASSPEPCDGINWDRERAMPENRIL
jgi:hypothetical protein